MWFERLTGFREDEVADVAAELTVADHRLTSRVNGRTLHHARFETPSLAELRRRVADRGGPSGRPTLDEVVADAQQLHLNPANAGAVFQVASQFNTLEMVSPTVTPEDGIDRYEADPTQGPACAVACGAGTIYRNYLVPLGSGRGQTAERQIDCLADLAAALGQTIEMRNGYAFPTGPQLDAVAERLARADERERAQLAGQLRVGVQWDTEVTLAGAGHRVTQVYCSALPVAYAEVAPSDDDRRWEPFARLVLDAAYEATLAVAALNRAATGDGRLYLTLVGGGVFGNRTDWIVDAVERAVDRAAATPGWGDLNVTIVSFRRPNPALAPLLDRPA